MDFGENKAKEPQVNGEKRVWSKKYVPSPHALLVRRAEERSAYLSMGIKPPKADWQKEVLAR